MALQTDNLVMIGLGILGDTPPDAEQPELVDGIHLRWSFLRELGFPWYGFFLFRRPHRPGKPICLGDLFAKMKSGAWPGANLNTPYGQFSSDTNLAFTDDSPVAGSCELDLRARKYLRFTLDPQETAYRVEAHIGFRGERRPDGKRVCVGFKPHANFVGPNPVVFENVRFEVRRHDGQPEAQTRVDDWANLAGLNCGFRLEITLPCAAHSVELTLSHFSSPGRVSGIDAAGNSVAVMSMQPQPRVPQTLQLKGKGIVRVIVDAPQDETLLHKICFVCDEGRGSAKAEIKVEALAGGLVVADQTVHGQPSEVVKVTLSADSISGVEVSGGEAALVDLCFYFVSQDAKTGWDVVPDFKYPMCLPVRHTHYPCSPHPTNLPASEGLALARVLYGPQGVWAGSPFAELHKQLVDLVEDGPAGLPMAQQNSLVAGTATPPDPEVDPPQMLSQYPLDLVLIAALHPAMAQMFGLYWADRSVPPSQPFDYLIVADHTGAGSKNPAKVLSVIQTEGFINLDGYIVFDKRMQPAPPLAVPDDVRCYALPGTTIATEDGVLLDATNNAGLHWDLELLAPGVIKPGGALMYIIWRDERSNAAAPAATGPYKLVTPDPVLVGEPVIPPGLTPARPPDWPPFPLHYIDSGLADGWYSYRVSGIDIFGRHSPNSADARWFQWTPEPQPRPWYYQNPPADSVIHPSAVRLLDKMGPPPPHAVEAYALDPADPTLLRDAVYDDWFDTLSNAEQENLIGLRVRWRWTEAHMRQAPDTREFRIYMQPDYLNSLVGRITGAAPASATETNVQTDIANTHGADAYTGAWLRIGANAFSVIGSNGATPLILRVKNIGAADEVVPPASAACTLTIPRVYNTGSVSVVRGSTLVTGTNTRWTVHLVGMTFKVVDEFAVYRIAAVNSQTELVLDRSYAESDGARLPYGIRFPLFTDFTVPLLWQERFYVVPYDEHVTVTVDGAGRPLRKYQLIIPVEGDAVRTGLQLATSLTVPVRYAHVGVSAADNKQHTTDDPQWATGNWGGPDRFGNEGPVSVPSKIFVVRRTPPPAPTVPADSERVFASRADYHSRSFYTYRWVPSASLTTHIFRALDYTLYQTDWERRAADSSDLDPNQTERFPSEWDAAKREQVADELNHLNTFNHDADKADAMSYYRALSNDGLRALAALRGNERAFVQLTIMPLDPDETANANRLGPDNPADYVIDPSLRAHIDTLDGRSSNRYFYRAAYVDGAHNRGPLSLSSPPVWLPDVVAPRTPVVTRMTGGDREITLRWASNREPDLAEYRVYRAESERDARDLRMMTLVHTAPVTADDISTPPVEVVWTDTGVTGLVTYYYRLAAADAVGNVSTPSRAFSGRAYDYGPPAEPVWERSEWVKLDAGGGEHAFSESDASLAPAVALVFTITQSNVIAIVQRQNGIWSSVTAWQKNPAHDEAAGVRRFTFYDRTADPGAPQRYRARLMTAAGVSLDSTEEREVAAP
jgi:hypothetical protein